MGAWDAPKPGPDEVTAVLGILDRYFDALQAGTAAYLLPNPEYQWRFYKGDVTIDRLRKGLKDLDAYLSSDSQKHWVMNHSNRRGDEIVGGPDLSRLTDAAVTAMFQECDACFASPNIGPPIPMPGEERSQS